MKIFMTGGTGFIGSHFINEALDRGFEINCIKRFKSFQIIKLKKTHSGFPRLIAAKYLIR